MKAQPMIVYGDLSCPFCYALEDRLFMRNLVRHVEWRLVEHAPDLPIEPGRATKEQLDQLAQELETIARRAPDVLIDRPAFAPNSALAIKAVAEAITIDPRGARTLRLLLFRALWREGKNIADPEVVAQQVAHAGLPPLRGTAEAAATAARWTHEWQQARFERIPVMISATGTRMLGLLPPRRLDLFLGSGLFSSSSEDACDVADVRQRS